MGINMPLPKTTRGWTVKPPAPDHGADALHWVESRELQALGPNDVLVNWTAWSINYPELAIANGSYPWAPPTPEPIPGSDAAGKVIAIGSAVQRFKVGDRVFFYYYPDFESGPAPNEETGTNVPGLTCQGVFCEYAVWNERRLAPSPRNLTDVETASIVCSGLTAWNALYGYLPIKPGSWVLAQGTGGVSMFAIQFAVAAGATVVATTGSKDKYDILKQIGVKHIINYREDPRWGETARKLTPGGLGFHHVIEVGGSNTIAQSFEAVGRGGVIDVIGFLTGQTNNEDSPSWISPLVRACTVRGIEVGSREQVTEMVTAIEARDIRPIMDSEQFTLKQVKDAYKKVWAGKHFGKVSVVGI